MSRTPRTSLCGLYRSRDSIFLGVCGGLAERFNLSPWGVRLFFVAVQFLVFRWTFLFYILFALILKPDPLARLRRVRWE